MDLLAKLRGMRLSPRPNQKARLFGAERGRRWAPIVAGTLLVLAPCVKAQSAQDQEARANPVSSVQTNGSVVLITVSGSKGLPPWQQDRIPDRWRGNGEQAAGCWWLGTGLWGSNDPVRSLFGLLSGIPPVRLEPLASGAFEAARKAELPLAILDAGGTIGGRVAGLGSQRAAFQSLVPGLRPFLHMKQVLRELDEVDTPFFYWLSLRSSLARQPSIIERVARIVDLLERQKPRSRAMVVVTSIQATGMGSPLAVFFPERHSCAGLLGHSELSLEVLGSILRQHAGFDLAPAMTRRGKTPLEERPVLQELLENGRLVGLSASLGDTKVSAAWPPGSIADCLKTTPGLCRWQGASPGTNSSTNLLLESLLLRELEKVIARSELGAVLETSQP